MGRRVTWVVVAAVAAVGVAAAVEALRGGSGARSTPPGQGETPAPTRVGEGLSGVLYYTDVNCTLRALELPELRPARAPVWGECRFALGPNGSEVGSPGSVWDLQGERVASESGGSIGASLPGAQVMTFTGSAPALRRDGMLTFVRDGALRLLPPGCVRLREAAPVVRVDAMVDRCSRVLLRGSELRRLALLNPNAPADPSLLRRVTVAAHAWLDDARLVLLVGLDVLAAGHFEQVVLVEGSRAVAVVPVSGGRLSGIQVSPRGSYFAVRAEDPDGVLLFDRDGNALAHPPVTRARAVAWSPGEQWTAVATPNGVEVWRNSAPNLAARRIGVQAGDLAWRLD